MNEHCAGETLTDPGNLLGIVGGGQLGRMLVQAARELGVECLVLDAEESCPASQLGARQVVGSLFDGAALRELVTRSSLTTFEIESTDVAVLAELEAAGHVIRPTPATLGLIQDKLLQKQFLKSHGIATSPFVAMERPSAGEVLGFGLPAVQKLRRGGYDGRGVRVFREEGDLDQLLQGPSLVEAFVPAVRELAVLGVRAVDGDIRCYSVVDMTLSPVTHMLEMLTAPADIPPDVAIAALDLGHRTIAAFGDVGVFAVEMFLTADGGLLVNEVSPRTHNSGHFTIDACATSQFEQHVRAVSGMPLGDVRQYQSAAMINLLGLPGFEGPPVLEGEAQALAIGGVHVHLYGKHECRPNRKMGHVTVVDDSLPVAVAKAGRVREILRIRGSHRLNAG
jgi:5-(carboxyamino)imidazole ribonucleotide synthase